MLEGVLLYRRSVFKLHCSDRFSSKTAISIVAFVSQNVQSFKKFTELNMRKFTANYNFASFGYADVVKYQGKLKN